MKNIQKYGPTAGWLLLLLVGCMIFTALPVLAVEEMPVPPAAGNCTKCHVAPDHPMDNCTKCHDLAKYEPQAAISGGHGGLIVSDTSKRLSTGPVGNCVVCHTYTNECENCHPTYFGYSTPPALIPDPNPRWTPAYSHDASRIDNYLGFDNDYNCEMCHIQTWWSNIPKHDAATFGSANSHASSTSGCGTCHSSSLTTEHYRRTSPDGLRPDCFSCHSSMSATVQQAVKSNNTGCGACHNAIHNIAASPQLPDKVLLYPGLSWSAPLPLSIWEGEPWVEENASDKRIVISSRAALSPDEVFAFYLDGMESLGWSLQSPPPAVEDSGFTAIFVNGTDKITVCLYSAESRSGEGTVSTGARIEIIFKG